MQTILGELLKVVTSSRVPGERERVRRSLPQNTSHYLVVRVISAPCVILCNWPNTGGNLAGDLNKYSLQPLDNRHLVYEIVLRKSINKYLIS